jgi:hypothetical protein
MMYNVVENERHIYMCAVVRIICSEVTSHVNLHKQQTLVVRCVDTVESATS